MPTPSTLGSFSGVTDLVKGALGLGPRALEVSGSLLAALQLPVTPAVPQRQGRRHEAELPNIPDVVANLMERFNGTAEDAEKSTEDAGARGLVESMGMGGSMNADLPQQQPGGWPDRRDTLDGMDLQDGMEMCCI